MLILRFDEGPILRFDVPLILRFDEPRLRLRGCDFCSFCGLLELGSDLFPFSVPCVPRLLDFEGKLSRCPSSEAMAAWTSRWSSMSDISTYSPQPARVHLVQSPGNECSSDEASLLRGASCLASSASAPVDGEDSAWLSTICSSITYGSLTMPQNGQATSAITERSSAGCG